MVIERFRGGDAGPVYTRFRQHGRLMPSGVSYVDSWVDATLTHCYQLVETADPTLLDRWMDQWRDLIEFDVHEVITSTDAAEQAATGR